MNKIDQGSPPSSEIVQSILGHIEWSSPTEGFCNCPGQLMHTTKTSERDCKIYLEPVPTITCFHASCVEVVQNASALIRRALAEGGFSQPKRQRVSPAERARKARRIELAQLKARAAGIQSRIQREFPWSYAAIVSDSPLAVEKHEIDHWRQFLDLFEQEEILWTGGVYDSGKEKHRENFQTKFEWQKQPFAPAPFTCPSTFVQGSVSRTAERGNVEIYRG